jgi:hypothetical protein
VYRLDKVVAEFEHPFFAWKSVKELEIDLELEVKQKLRRITKVEAIRGIARSPMPDIDVSRIGVPGTDFREVREYVAGDPVRFINWKATARSGKLMVNQYEVEGKKAVWIFVDTNAYMTYGESIRNFLEVAIEIANSLAYYFTSRGHKVGLYVIGHSMNLYPDVGKRQFRRISDKLTMSSFRLSSRPMGPSDRLHLPIFNPHDALNLLSVYFDSPIKAQDRPDSTIAIPGVLADNPLDQGGYLFIHASSPGGRFLKFGLFLLAIKPLVKTTPRKPQQLAQPHQGNTGSCQLLYTLPNRRSSCSFFLRISMSSINSPSFLSNCLILLSFFDSWRLLPPYCKPSLPFCKNILRHSYNVDWVMPFSRQISPAVLFSFNNSTTRAVFLLTVHRGCFFSSMSHTSFHHFPGDDTLLFLRRICVYS